MGNSPAADFSSPRPSSPLPAQQDELELSGSPGRNIDGFKPHDLVIHLLSVIATNCLVTGAPVVESPSVVSPLVTLKHGSGRTSGIVKPKQEVQKKEEEVGNLFGRSENLSSPGLRVFDEKRVPWKHQA